jgi:hypothetical protein
MDIALLSAKLELAELANRLFMYTDARNWDGLQAEVFTPELWLDVESLGGGAPRTVAARELCEMWAQGFADVDAVHHQAGHYLIEVQGTEATIFAYSVASHYKASATQGFTRAFVGDYNLKATATPTGWRLTQFKYNLKFTEGNATLT